MNSLYETWVCIFAIAFISGNSLIQASDEDADASKKDIGVLRLGRGLQMLRLGKRSTNWVPMMRSSRSLDDTDNMSTSDVQSVLASIFDQARDETRRQPPLPRYGRDSNMNTRLLVDALSDDSGLYSSDLFPFSSSRFSFRPAPRGGRYKRSFPAGRYAYGDYLIQDGAGRTRAVTMPRYETFIMDDVARLQAKAVPRPRIGRYQNDQSDDSFQTKTA